MMVNKAADFARIATRLDNVEQKVGDTGEDGLLGWAKRLYRVTVGGSWTNGYDPSNDETIFDTNETSLYRILFGVSGADQSGITDFVKDLIGNENNLVQRIFGSIAYFPELLDNNGGSLASMILSKVDADVSDIGERLDLLEAALGALRTEFDALKSNLEDVVLPGIQSQFDGVNAALSSHASRLSAVESRLASGGL